MVSSEYMWRPWGDLHHAVLTGKPGFDRVHGASVLEYLAAHPNELAIRNAAMTSISSVELPQILAAYDFSQFKCIADLRGGHGTLLYGILSKHPKVRGILADLPHCGRRRNTLALQANGGALRDNRYWIFSKECQRAPMATC